MVIGLQCRKSTRGLSPGHVLVDGDDVDVGLAQRLEHALQLALLHREVTVDDRLVVAAGERGPGVDAHLPSPLDVPCIVAGCDRSRP